MFRRWTVWAVVGVSLTGCSVGPEVDADETDGDLPPDYVEPDRTNGEPPVAQIVIPMRPLTTAELYAVPELEETAEGLRLRFDTRLTFALAEGYPRAFAASLPREWFGTCGVAEAPIVLSELSGGDDVASVELVDGAIDIDILGPGRTMVIGEGAVTFQTEGCGQPAGAVLPVDFSLAIDGRPATDARIDAPCASDPVLVAPSSGPSRAGFSSWFQPRLVDAQGDFYADNAAPDAQVTVRLRGSFDAAHASSPSLETWIPPSRPGLVEIAPEFGEALAVEVITPEQVTRIDFEMQVPGGKSPPLRLDDGETYGEQWGYAFNRVAPMVQAVHVGEAQLCSSPATAWFDLITNTPQTCRVVGLPPLMGDDNDALALDGDRIGRALRLEADGPCSLELHVPDLANAVGFPAAFSATFTNIDELQE